MNRPEKEEYQAQVALNKMAEFFQKQKDLDFERRKKRNAEVDALISQLGDPKVAEKLRIYRLVEEQFTHIEAEVEKEVKEKMEQKKKHTLKPKIEPKLNLKKSDTKVTSNLLLKAKIVREQLASQLECNDPPEPIKDNLAKIKAEKQALAKEKLLGHRTNPRKPKQQISYRPEPVQKIPNAKFKKNDPKKKMQFFRPSDSIQMLSEPIIKDLSGSHEQKRQIKNNVGYESFVEPIDETDHSERILTAHVLRGVNIEPRITATVSKTLQSQIIEELHETVQNDSSSSSNPDTIPKDMPKLETEEVSIIKEEPLKLSKDKSISPKIHEEQLKETTDEYSDSFEDDDELAERILPKILENQALMADDEDSMKGRL